VFGAEIGHSFEHEQVLFRAHDLTASRTSAMIPLVDRGRKGLAATIRFCTLSEPENITCL